MKSPLLEKKVFAWALYDWANSAFATTVMVVFFPLFFKQYLAAGQDATTSTFWLGIANGISSFVLAVMAPWLGALADKGSAHVRFLAAFTAIGVMPTALLAFVGPGDWVHGGSAVRDRLARLLGRAHLLRLDAGAGRAAAAASTRCRASAMRSAIWAAALLLAVNVADVLRSRRCSGCRVPEAAIRASFVTVAVWWLLFAIPLLRSAPQSAGAPRHRRLARAARRIRGAGAHVSRSAPLSPGRAVPARVLDVHRRRQHDHEDGGRLRARARLSRRQPDRRHPDDPVHRLSRRRCCSAGSATASARWSASSSASPCTRR